MTMRVVDVAELCFLKLVREAIEKGEAITDVEWINYRGLQDEIKRGEAISLIRTLGELPC